MQALHLRQLASNWLGSLSVRASWICGLFCVSAVLIPVWVDVLIPVWGRLNVCTDPCLCASGCTRPRTSPLSSGSPITLDLWERIHPQGLWNQQGSLQLSYLISLCRSTISTSYFRLLVVGSRADLQQPRPPCCLSACTLVEAKAKKTDYIWPMHPCSRKGDVRWVRVCFFIEKLIIFSRAGSDKTFLLI